MVSPGPETQTTIAQTSSASSPTADLVHQTLDRITFDPEVMGGVPCIRDLQIRVSTLVNMTVDGMSYEEILDEFPLLEAEDIDQGLEYAARAIRRFLALPLMRCH